MKQDAARGDHGSRVRGHQPEAGDSWWRTRATIVFGRGARLTASRRLPARLGSRWLAAGCEVQKAEALQNRYLIPTATTFEEFGANAPQ